MKPDFTQMNVEEVRKLYCEKSGVTMEEAAQIKPKSALVEKLEQFYPPVEAPKLNIENSPFSLAEIETATQEAAAIAEAKEGVVPERGSEGWQDYVLNLLRDDEYILKEGKRYPKASGLRRLVELLLGDIISSGPVQVTSPNNANGNNATVVYKLVVLWKFGLGHQRDFSDVADAGPSNTPQEYACHASATASSRAAGRAFRSALLLTINTAEEMNNASTPLTNGPTDDIRLLTEESTPIQHVGIKTMCTRLGISIDKLLEHNALTKTLENLKKAEAHNLLLQLNQYSSDGNDSLAVPDSIKEQNEQS